MECFIFHIYHYLVKVTNKLSYGLGVEVRVGVAAGVPGGVGVSVGAGVAVYGTAGVGVCMPCTVKMRCTTSE